MTTNPTKPRKVSIQLNSEELQIFLTSSHLPARLVVRETSDETNTVHSAGSETELSKDPFDHNGECIYCDEFEMHRPNCPWLLKSHILNER